jgi:hypothetical protein
VTVIRVLAASICGVLLNALPGVAGAAATGPPAAEPLLSLPAGWSVDALPGARPDVVLQVLKRETLAIPVRYLVVVLPGSGCTGWRPVATRYFAGLLHAELLVLHKPQVDIDAGLSPECSNDFVQSDTLSAWRDHARSALRAHFAANKLLNPVGPTLPVLLVGVSEGAELLPDLAPVVPHLAGMVMISAPGLDPLETGQLQAQRLGEWSAWLALAHLQGSQASDETLHQGRTLGYWRDFWRWRLAQPLLNAPWPLLRVWGGADAMTPELAYERFTQQSQGRLASSCHIRLPDADHGLQSDKLDGLQWLWARIEVWARSPASGFCAAVGP